MALYEGVVVKTNTMETLESSTPMVVGLAGGGYVVAWNRNNVVPYTVSMRASTMAMAWRSARKRRPPTGAARRP